MRRTRNPHSKRGSKVRAARVDLEREVVADRLAARSVVLAVLNEIIESGGRIRWGEEVFAEATPELAERFIDAVDDSHGNRLDAARCLVEVMKKDGVLP